MEPATARRLSWWDGSVLNLLGDAAVAGVAWPLAWHGAQVTRLGLVPYGWGTVVIVTAVVLALFVRRRFPIAAAVVAALAMICAGVWLAIPLACYTVASRRGNTAATWLVTAGAAAAVSVPWGVRYVQDDLLFGTLLSVAVVGFPVFVGLWVGQRRQLVAGLRDRAEQAERERDLRTAGAIDEERRRIARELHDVVAHRVSQIAVQAGALAVSSDGRTADVAEAIRGTSTTALEEMRELLGVLRRGDGDAPLHPAPTLSGLRQLVDEAVATGQRVTVTAPDEPPPVPGSTGRAVYRLVQESLTNAAKHAPGAAVDVTLGVDDAELAVTVRNAPGVPAALRSGPPPGSGFGLAGMRERVELAGGTLVVGPTSDGGFCVVARFGR